MTCVVHIKVVVDMSILCFTGAQDAKRENIVSVCVHASYIQRLLIYTARISESLIPHSYMSVQLILNTVHYVTFIVHVGGGIT